MQLGLPGLVVQEEHTNREFPCSASTCPSSASSTKEELKNKVRDHLKGKNPQRWNAMSDDEQKRLKTKLAEIIESR